MGRIRVEPQAYILAALWLLILPWNWALGALTAAAVHEMAHILTVYLTGGRLLELRIGGCGAVMRTSPMGAPEEAVCALAGPLCSFSLAFLSRVFPEAALWGFAQGLFNLLPFYPLDGGRALRAVLPEPVFRGVEASALVILTGVGIYAALGLNLGPVGLIPAIAVIIRLLTRKIPCKESILAVQ